jgi:hypothetical protein
LALGRIAERGIQASATFKLRPTGDVFRVKDRDYEKPATTRRHDEIALLSPGGIMKVAS